MPVRYVPPGSATETCEESRRGRCETRTFQHGPCSSETTGGLASNRFTCSDKTSTAGRVVDCRRCNATRKPPPPMCQVGKICQGNFKSALRTQVPVNRYCIIERQARVKPLAAHKRHTELQEDDRTVQKTEGYLLGQLTFYPRRWTRSRTAQRSCMSPAKPRAQWSVLSYGDPKPARENDSKTARQRLGATSRTQEDMIHRSYRTFSEPSCRQSALDCKH